MRLAEHIVLFFAIVIVGLLLSIVNFILFFLAGFEDKVNSPAFYIVLVVSWSLSVTWLVSKIFKNDE